MIYYKNVIDVTPLHDIRALESFWEKNIPQIRNRRNKSCSMGHAERLWGGLGQFDHTREWQKLHGCIHKPGPLPSWELDTILKVKDLKLHLLLGSKKCHKAAHELAQWALSFSFFGHTVPNLLKLTLKKIETLDFVQFIFLSMLLILYYY